MNKTKKRKTSKYLTGGQAAVQCLKKEQVRHVFGLIGSATMEMFDALYHEKKIKFIDISNNLLKILNKKEFIKYKHIKPKNIDEINKLSNYVSLKINSMCI